MLFIVTLISVAILSVTVFLFCALFVGVNIKIKFIKNSIKNIRHRSTEELSLSATSICNSRDLSESPPRHPFDEADTAILMENFPLCIKVL